MQCIKLCTFDKIFNVKCDVRSVRCDVRRASCDVWCATCDVWRVTCDVRRVTCDVWCPTGDVRRMTCDITIVILHALQHHFKPHVASGCYVTNTQYNNYHSIPWMWNILTEADQIPLPGSATHNGTPNERERKDTTMPLRPTLLDLK